MGDVEDLAGDWWEGADAVEEADSADETEITTTAASALGTAPSARPTKRKRSAMDADTQKDLKMRKQQKKQLKSSDLEKRDDELAARVRANAAGVLFTLWDHFFLGWIFLFCFGATAGVAGDELLLTCLAWQARSARALCFLN